MQYEKARSEVDDTFEFYKAAIEERRQEVLRDMETTYRTRQVTLSGQLTKLQSVIDRY